MNEARSHLIVALDLPDRSSAMSTVDRLAGHIGCFKIGLELFINEGPRIVEEILRRGEKVFLDLKLHDIPNTVAGAVRSACRLGVHMLTLHASGGARMLEAARAAAETAPSPPLLLAVSALTSLSSEEIQRLGVREPVSVWVEKLAEIAYQAGIRGLVASPLELSRLRPAYGGKMRFVCPGIRPAGTPTQDQSRTAEPGEAIKAGADFIVVGRPIVQAHDPARAADAIVEEIEIALRRGFYP